MVLPKSAALPALLMPQTHSNVHLTEPVPHDAAEASDIGGILEVCPAVDHPPFLVLEKYKHNVKTFW